jgi:acetyl-CoA carboxylase carboxyl transferase subunit alpha
MADKPRTPPDAASGGMAFERPIQEIEARLSELEELSQTTELDLTAEIEALRGKLEVELSRTYSQLGAWETVNVARHPGRPVAGDYVTALFEDFFELHGDRAFGDDRAMVTGLATLDGRRILLVGHRKGRTTKERLACNFGCAHPEGYRKALRKMRLAQKLGLPIVCLVNTPGAYPGIGAEERGQAMAIAENIYGMLELRVPIVVVVIGEGGSGGALGIGVGDRVFQMQHAYYSVISPEGCAAILWKDGERSPDAAEALKLTAPDLEGLGVIDGVIEEPLGGAHRDPAAAMESVKQAVLGALDELEQVDPDELVAQRREKYRRIAEIPGRFPVVEAAP